ncbi:formylglycine-generating enzyme required for sulfatase activity/class 3 adenylate cyclase [Bradyrhizobium elkanii]|uniref:SUMF1/EgtB/PvdO family nonheme iron enzyme n=1 Tax=Bradyrhizobium elkanii TaxID=29448 RepID=UPI0020A1BF69|nr:SUMF1/EgtB/PvdO family nonheme iron enzyme [Bradyrhizobium elkanii]MCP1967710.1 formylglycine-generating enzyme required for sulfatase activity/class 3 adenylate cyclase [Bradyrhizobium elkanii]MCS3524005.1 formylglycine-generating enzyme required for sulfatase activity/class 3 adenylate cyclase [Bradyrhizobium elkanii]MCS4071661.1 formylglycine-generating enzyme required for sulfatase activity/class 3 adenylate cyclase [Bradyrhizobium elkanii]MCS4078293.1 formylglycine-generating enzyme req
MGEIRDFKSGRSQSDNTQPPGTSMPRRLAAIVVGDIAGYSRLMQLDEEGTHTRVKRAERDLIEPTIAEHHGKLVKTTGDGFIAIFDSPVEAVRCSIVIQQNMIGRNAAIARDRWIEYRIGVNLGDVIIEADDIYGDGVNVASRLEGIAAPGEVFISGGIYEQIKHKMVCGYESLGDRKVKNITDPVRVYRVLPDAAAYQRTRRRRESILLTLLGLAIAIIAGGVLWYLLAQPRGKPADVAQAPPSPTASPAVQPPAPSPAPTQTASPTPAAPTQQASPQPAPSASPTPDLPEPELVLLQAGSFSMGSNDDPSERPIRRVTVKPFAMGKYPVTIREWNACAAAQACGFTASGKDDVPVTNVSWSDAKQYVTWLAERTKKPYRLPSEAEWEYAARGGTQSKYWWGDQMQSGHAGCKDCGGDSAAEQPVKVGSLKPNPFGLYDMGGGVDQWVEDCWHRNYQGAPTDGAVWSAGDCASHVIRSGSWKNDARYVRPANRDNYDTNVRYPTHGFRVALSP